MPIGAASALLPRTVCDALINQIAFNRFDLGPIKIAILGQTFAERLRCFDIGIWVVGSGTNCQHAERGERNECPPGAVVAHAVAFSPD